MSKFWVMGATLLISFSAGLYVFIPEQHGKFLPDFTPFLTSAVQKPVLDEPKLESGQSILGAAGEVEDGQRAADGSIVIKDALPPELKMLDTEIAGLNTALQEERVKVQPVTSPSSDAQAEKIIQQADKLVAETNKKHGIDTSHVAAIMASSPPITDPELKQIQEKLDVVDKDIHELEQRYRQ